MRQAFYLSEPPSPLMTTYSPPLYIQYRVLIQTGKGEELTREKVRGAIVHKAGSKITTLLTVSPVYKLYYLTSVTIVN
jgi:hypothetical protein